ncbi:phage tail protein [Vibrio azureus]|uniref:Putative phage tail protein n=1 Tax=Vibrio azureus NBRC 104587 TaxID=1219077 RepID=U3C0A0_9VIBR|nr:phage tail protein [Vibrio azureus]AUI88162.1 phage tail protein [Vibrio azureus]GAD74944.1 putative phage tail protein [Vibrio azureus NBRC 104587]
MSYVVQYTDAGLAELISAQHQGLKAAIKTIAVGDRSYTPTTDQQALHNERQREVIVDWEELSPTQLRMSAVFKGNQEYEVREVGFFLASGTLLALYSAPNTLLTYKSANSSWLQKFTLDVSPLPSDSITVEVGTENLNLLMFEEVLTAAIATISLGTTQIKIAHQQWLLSERLRAELD